MHTYINIYFSDLNPNVTQYHSLYQTRGKFSSLPYKRYRHAMSYNRNLLTLRITEGRIQHSKNKSLCCPFFNRQIVTMSLRGYLINYLILVKSDILKSNTIHSLQIVDGQCKLCFSCTPSYHEGNTVPFVTWIFKLIDPQSDLYIKCKVLITCLTI